MGFFARIGRVIRGWFGRAATNLEERNPEALMEVAKQDFRDKMNQYRQSLARMAGIAERLKVQIKTKTDKAEDLQRRILANHSAGNLELAGSLARELQELKVDVGHDQQELQDTEAAYQTNLAQMKVAQKEFDDKIKKLESQLSQLKVKEAQAEAASALNGVAYKVGDLGDTTKTVEEVLNKRLEVSAGKARLAQDLAGQDQVQEKEKERKALESQALAEFLAAQGISAGTGGSQDSPPQKEIGPQAAEQKTMG